MSKSDYGNILTWLEPSIQAAVLETAEKFDAQDSARDEFVCLIESAGSNAPELAIKIDNVVLTRLVASIEFAYRRGFCDAMKIKSGSGF